ncbi:uncharacterized protein LOC126742385 isoform X1 [Anthonomus grandis grandis]|uniref:uncharacterized protein LOC126742385 isoform X1 n=1 Tax=Anthonomus grandis grandis TaxID=2921223 RepID=UPI0021665512|nr:uncharacterized protein LOC126742385 isoform X1 [Anthonomus grandis grandis]XP_050305002.1 uncharacterized protein LOC126742385 isoform X1 [Anthonomus grandis grandis]
MSLSLRLVTTILILLVFPSSEDDQELWERAKRELAERTREYIKNNPISDELRSFIEELSKTASEDRKRRFSRSKLDNPFKQADHQRRKRQEYSNLYAIKDGDVVPLYKIEENLNTASNLGDNFTVVPLIIPIPLENNITLKSTSVEPTIESFGGVDGGKAILGRGQALAAVHAAKMNQAAINSDGKEATEETVVDSLVEDKLKSTKGDDSVTALSRVLEDVQNLINAQSKGKKSSKEGNLCNVTGYWDSELGGVTFHIKKKDNGTAISMKPTEPPSEEGFIGEQKWNISARIPFPQSAQVIITLTAHKGRRVALFLGECRVCDGSETITGDWLVGRTSSDCKDQKASHSFVSDVMRKNNVQTLRAAHLAALTNFTSSSTTEMD